MVHRGPDVIAAPRDRRPWWMPIATGNGERPAVIARACARWMWTAHRIASVALSKTTKAPSPTKLITRPPYRAACPHHGLVGVQHLQRGLVRQRLQRRPEAAHVNRT